jgi:hypothetical protein
MKMPKKFFDEPENVQISVDKINDLKEFLEMNVEEAPEIELPITDAPVATEANKPEIEKKVKFAEADDVKIIEDSTEDEDSDGASTTSSIEEASKERPLLETFRKFADAL